ncbi:MAG: PEP-CTERM sorting domain-containing protein, partial [Cephaloticoccus sp.]|nr:PEP-CTERM sorting domain-containing protein [Cephaloticoccus sp.]
QETAMDPDIAANQRKYLTELDLAGLQDIGYTAVPEPATLALLAGAGALGLAVRRRRRVRA